MILSSIVVICFFSDQVKSGCNISLRRIKIQTCDSVEIQLYFCISQIIIFCIREHSSNLTPQSNYYRFFVILLSQN